jgi:hypothetical protein
LLASHIGWWLTSTTSTAAPLSRARASHDQRPQDQRDGDGHHQGRA